MMVMIKFLQDYNFTSVCNMRYHCTTKKEMEIPSMVTGSSNMEPFCPILSCHPTGTQVIQVILMIGMVLAAIGLLLHSRGPLIAPTIPPEPMETRCKNREATDINPRAYGSLMLVNYDVPTNSILNCLSLGSSVVMLNKYTQVITVVPCKTKGSGFLSNQLYKSWMYSCAGMRTHLVTLLV